MHRALAFLCLASLSACGGGATVVVTSMASNLFKAFQTPAEFMAVVLKFEGLRGTDDADPAVIFDAGDDSYQAAVVDLTEAAQTLYEGQISTAYLGTYTHARITVAGVGQVISYADPAGNAAEKGYLEALQDFDNTAGAVTRLPAGAITRGDVLVAEGTGFEWFQIDASRTYRHSAVRSQVSAFQDATPGDPAQLIELTAPVTIEAAGAYELLIDFDVTNTFSYTDLDDDAMFEPLSDDHDGNVNGFSFGILVPTLAISAVE